VAAALGGTVPDVDTAPALTRRTVRVLLVEDEPPVQAGIATLLEIEPDLELVGTVATAEEALELLDRLAPDVVLLDNALDGALTGVQAAPLLKERAPALVVLMCTADPGDLATQDPAIDGCLCKERLDVLPDAVRQLVGSA
jgi:DNA-binding NarL/FixJ family response regulator